MNPWSPFAPFRTAWVHRGLIASLTLHGIASRYRTSWFGLLWPILQPVLLIGVFSFVFGYVMPLRWGGEQGGAVQFPLFLYSGLVVFTFFAEVVNRAPTLVLENVNLVKKVVFPLEVLTLVSVLTSLVFFLVNVAVFLVFVTLSGIGLTGQILQLFVMIVPFVLFLAGVSWFVAGLTVYVRDVVHVIGIVVSAMMFLAPVFYPLSSVPEAVQAYLAFNPLALAIESLRTAVFAADEAAMHGGPWLWGCGLVSFYLGHLWFLRVREGFSDVL